MIWEVALHRQLLHDGTRFTLDVQFTSQAARLALFGPSGSGKTQTLKMMAGIAHPDSGRVCIAGRVLQDSASGIQLTPQQRRLGYVFQDGALFPHLNVRQNIAVALQPAGRRWLNPQRRVRHAAVERWIEALRLQAVAGHQPHQISGGQRQRTALARALVNDPAALLLDEPFAALDKPLRQHLRNELRELQAQLRIPMLLITHDDDDVQALADEVLQLHAGRVRSSAPPARDQPSPTFLSRHDRSSAQEEPAA